MRRVALPKVRAAVIARCAHVVQIPTKFCLNVGLAGALVMYDRLLAQTDDTSLIRVLTNLRNASADSHLPAFEAAAANGGTLTPEQMASYQLGR